MRLILVRHGESYHVRDGIIAERIGCRGLTDNGVAQAQSLAHRFHTATDVQPVHVLLSSPVLRAQQTAETLGLGQIAYDRDLCEIYPGNADGLSWQAYEARYGAFDLPTAPTRPFAPGGESWQQFLERVQTTLQRYADQFADQTVVAVTHAGFIVASLVALFAIPRPGTRARFDPLYTSITEWLYVDEAWRLLRFNDVSHLAQ